MSDLTLESLAKRVEALEKVIATKAARPIARIRARSSACSATANSCAKSTRNACGARGRTGGGTAGRLRRMILLGTDHTTFVKYPDSERGRRMIDRPNAMSASEVIGVAIVTVEQRMAAGWR